MSGLFITFEGIEKSGKTTQAELLSERLKREGYDVVLTREPGGTPIAEEVRTLILDPEHTDMSPQTELLLFEASRTQHVQELIRPSLLDGKAVICDRFTDSTLAYQGYGRGIPLDTIEQLNRIAVSGCEPDLTFFLDIPLQLWLERQANQSVLPDRLENEAMVSYAKAGKADVDQRPDQPQLSMFRMGFHEKVREGYLKLAEQYPQRIHTMDGTRPAEEVARKVHEVVVDRLAASGVKPSADQGSA